MILTKENKIFLLKRDGEDDKDISRVLYKSISQVLTKNFRSADRVPETGYEIIEYDLVEVGRIPIGSAHTRLPKTSVYRRDKHNR